MLRNNVKLALRHLWKQKSYTAVNIGGLALGIVCCLLIVLYLRFELSFDRHNANYDRIVRVVSDREVGGSVERMANAPFPVGPTLASTFPEIVQQARVFRATNGASVTYAAKPYSEPLFFFVDPEVVDVFTFEFISGAATSVFEQPNSVVISERASTKYFGSGNPMGRTLTAGLLGKSSDLVVTGVVKNWPAASHFDFDFLVPFNSPLNGWNQGTPGWDSGILGAWTYLLLSDPSAAGPLSQKLAAFAQNTLPSAMKDRLVLSLQPLARIHLHSHRIGELEANSSVVYVYVFAGIALLVLLIACVNFINLSTAQSIGRAKEIGILKAFGAGRIQLVMQHLGEAFLLSIFAVALAAAVVMLALPVFSTAVGRPIPSFDLLDPIVIGSLAGMWLFIGVLSGLYPAFVMARYSPVTALKGEAKGRSSRLGLRSGLIVGQFAVALILLITSLTVLDQLDYVKHRSLGFEREQLVVVTSQGDFNFDVFKGELAKSPDIRNVTVTARVPGGRHLSTNLMSPENADRGTQLRVPFLRVEQEFVKTLELNVIEGRDFRPGDQFTAIINRTTERLFGWQENSMLQSRVSGKTEAVGQADGTSLGQSLGKSIVQFGRDSEQIWTVVGVVDDVHFESLHTGVKPLVLGCCVNFGSRIIVRIGTDNVEGAIEQLQNTWAGLSPDIPLDYYFLDEAIGQLYVQEERLGKVIQAFTLLAVFISCIGLFGMVALTTEQRTKEMGIRKVLGASTVDILTELSRQYITLAAVAAVIAIPAAYFLVDRWLDVFAYRVDVTAMTVLGATSLVLVVVAIIVAIRSIKTASIDPVRTLRYE